MNRISLARVASFGLLVGVVWTLLSAAVLAVVGENFVAALPERSSSTRLFLLGANIVAGVWAVWLYASIRSHYGPGIKSAVITGVSWWTIQSLQSSKWVALGTAPISASLGPAFGTLPAMVLAVALGAWCYENYRSPSINRSNRAA